MPQTPYSSNPQTPFAPRENRARPTLGLGMILISMVIFAAISSLLMLAARVPAISDSINDMLGVRSSNTDNKPDRSTHLFMLLFCYTSPLMLMLWVSLLKSLRPRRSQQPANQAPTTTSDPFA